VDGRDAVLLSLVVLIDAERMQIFFWHRNRVLNASHDVCPAGRSLLFPIGERDRLVRINVIGFSRIVRIQLWELVFALGAMPDACEVRSISGEAGSSSIRFFEDRSDENLRDHVLE
jgi:hypothetical protein